MNKIPCETCLTKTMCISIEEDYTEIVGNGYIFDIRFE